MRQILLNLLGNAIKFTQEGTIKLTLKKTETDNKADNQSTYFCFTVSDNGIGIAADKLTVILINLNSQIHQQQRIMVVLALV